jgi:hypothetical protein
MTMQEEIGTAAGSIWQALNTRGEFSLAQLKKEVKAKTPLFIKSIGTASITRGCFSSPEPSLDSSVSSRTNPSASGSE